VLPRRGILPKEDLDHKEAGHHRLLKDIRHSLVIRRRPLKDFRHKDTRPKGTGTRPRDTPRKGTLRKDIPKYRRRGVSFNNRQLLSM